MLKGKRLKPGSTIGIIAPANYAPKEDIEKGQKRLEELGYKILLGKSCFEKWFSFSGSDDLRANDINEMFADRSVDAILCLRGGYGSIRLLDKIDFSIIKNNPKLFIGYSDITALHVAINKCSDLATVHGPMLTSNISNDFDSLSESSFLNVITGENYEDLLPPDSDAKVLTPGEAKGQIIGGNLASLVSTLGTRFEVETKNKVLFLEEINEHTYRIDRMLNQLRLAGKLGDCCGVILGNFKDCNKEKPEDFSLNDIFENTFSNFNKPVIYNFQSGHCFPMISIPLGVECYLKAFNGNVSVKLLESPVI